MVILESTLTCPACGTAKTETMPTDACQFFYECSGCGERFVGVRRCEHCNLYCRAVGVGGSCPECDTPVLIDDLLGAGVIATP